MGKKLTSRAILLPVGLAALAALALGLWFGAFGGQQAAATPPLEDLTVVVSSDPASGTVMAEGSVVTYTVTVAADGQTTTANVPLSIDLSGLTLIGASLSAGTGITCAAGDPIACTVAVFAAASSRDVTFQASVDAGGPALVGAVLDTPIDGGGSGLLTEEGSDAGTVDGGNADGDDGDDPGLTCGAVGEGTDVDPVEEPDNFDCTSHTVGTADLTIIKSASPTETTAIPTGGTIIYTLTVANKGSATGTATGVPVRETFESPSKVAVTNVTVTAPDSCADTSLPEINCTIASLAPGTSRIITVVVTVTAAAGATVLDGAYVDPDDVITETDNEADDPYLNCAAVGEVPGGTTEPDNFDCTAHTVGTVDLTITKSASPSDGSTVATGATITYTLTASATGETASDVAIRDKLGTGLTFVSIAGSTGVTCSDTTGPEYDCTASTVVPGTSRTVTVVATVSATSGSVLNGALVDPSNSIVETNDDAGDPALECAAVGEGSDSGGATSEPDNFDCTSHTVGAGLDLTISKTATPTDGTSVSTGANITYTLSVSATGATANNVLIRDKPGTGLTFVSITGGTGVTCADTTGPEYDCTASTVAPGTNRTVTVVATVSATSGTVLNGARVDPGSAIAETNEDADDPGLDCTTVDEGADTDPVTEPDNFDCTSHTVGAAGTRTLNLSPAGWHSFVWTGASATDPATALSCISGKYSIAYEWVGTTTPPAWLRYVPGQPTLSSITAVNKYDALLVLITADGVTCQMSVAP